MRKVASIIPSLKSVGSATRITAHSSPTVRISSKMTHKSTRSSTNHMSATKSAHKSTKTSSKSISRDKTSNTRKSSKSSKHKGVSKRQATVVPSGCSSPISVSYSYVPSNNSAAGFMLDSVLLDNSTSNWLPTSRIFDKFHWTVFISNHNKLPRSFHARIL